MEAEHWMALEAQFDVVVDCMVSEVCYVVVEILAVVACLAVLVAALAEAAQGGSAVSQTTELAETSTVHVAAAVEADTSRKGSAEAVEYTGVAASRAAPAGSKGS